MRDGTGYWLAMLCLVCACEGPAAGPQPEGDGAMMLAAEVALPAAGLEGTPGSPVVALDGSGSAVALWVQQRGGGPPDYLAPEYALFASRQVVSGAWEPPQIVAPWSNTLPSQPAVASSLSGAAIAAWSGGGPFASRFVPGRGWSPPEAVAAVPMGDIGWLRVAIDDHGDALVAWTAVVYAQPEMVLSARLAQASSEWLEATELARVQLAGDWQAPFDLALGPDGRALVAWREQLDAGSIVQARRGQQADGSLGKLVWDPAEKLAEAPVRIAAVWARLDGRGESFVGWATSEASEGNYPVVGVTGVRAAPGAPFGAAVSIADGLPAQFGFEASLPRLAASPAGDMILAWRDSTWPDDFANPEASSIRARRYSPVDGWLPEEAVAEDLAPPYFGCAALGAQAFEVAANGDGAALVVWLDGVVDGSLAPNVQARARTATRGWGDTVLLGSLGSAWQRELTAALNAKTGSVLWTEQGTDEVSGAVQTSLRAARLEWIPAR